MLLKSLQMLKGSGLVIAGWIEHKNVSAYSGYCESRYWVSGWGKGLKAERLANYSLLCQKLSWQAGDGNSRAAWLVSSD